MSLKVIHTGISCQYARGNNVIKKNDVYLWFYSIAVKKVLKRSKHSRTERVENTDKSIMSGKGFCMSV